MGSEWEAYLKAADRQRALGSDVSTATGCSSQTSMARGLGSDSTLASQRRTPLSRTPLSSQAPPFVSSFGMYASSAEPVQMQDQHAKRWVSEDYSEVVQEDVYLCQNRCADVDRPPYSETLQEDVYLPNKRLPSQSSLSCRERGRQAVGGEVKSYPSRTPSPCDASDFLSEAGFVATNMFSIAPESTSATDVPPGVWTTSESQAAQPIKVDMQEKSHDQPPVKRTFIHYDTSVEDGTAAKYHAEVNIDGPRRLAKSTSAPSILLRNIFRIIEKRSMAERHLVGQCSPCAYFCHKEDGCRWGTDCKFCHMCPSDEIKKRKKKKVKDRKHRRMEKLAGLPQAGVLDEVIRC